MFQNLTKLLSKQNTTTRFTNISKTFSKKILLNQNQFPIQYPTLAKSLQSSFIHSTRYSFKDRSLSLSNSYSTSETHSGDSSHAQTSSSDTSSTTAAHNPNARLLIAFTCKVCSFRSTKTMSRRAYDHGVVIIQCSSCQNRHLIADNLGWFRDGRTTIEDLMYEQGEKVLKFVDNTNYVLEWCPDVIEKEKKKLKELKKSKIRKELSLGLDETDKVKELEEGRNESYDKLKTAK